MDTNLSNTLRAIAAVQAARRQNWSKPVAHDADLEQRHQIELAALRTRLSALSHSGEAGTSETPPPATAEARGGFVAAAGKLLRRVFQNA